MGLAHDAEVERIREITRIQQKERADYSLSRESRSGSESKKRRREPSASETKASVAASAAALNEGIGGKMLKKMGWKQGEGLGKDATGTINPIEVSRRSERAGLGAGDGELDVELDPNDTYQVSSLPSLI